VDIELFWHNQGNGKSSRFMLMNDQDQIRAFLHQNVLWSQAFEQNPSIQLIVDPNKSVIIDANPRACRFYGYNRTQMRGMSFGVLEVETLPVDNLTEDSTIHSYQHRTAKGDIRSVKVNSNALTVDTDTLIQLIVFDITKRRRAEAAEQGQRLLAEALVNTAAALVNTLNLDEVLDRVLEQVEHILPNEYVNIMLVENDITTIARARGYERVTNVETYRQLQVSVSATPTLRWMTEHRSALAIPNVKTSPLWIPMQDTIDWLKSYLGAPIRMGSYVIGFLNLDSSVTNRFSEQDAYTLQAFADQAAIAIRNARLFDRMRNQTMISEKRVAERTAELNYEREQLHTILDAMTEGVIYQELDANRNLQTRYVNRVMLNMLGYETDETPPNLQDIFSFADVDASHQAQIHHDVAEALRINGVWTSQLRFKPPNRLPFDASVTSTQVNGTLGTDRNPDRLQGIVTILRDNTQEQALQRQRSRFVAQASHELRTPLTNLKTRAYLMRKQPEKFQDHLEILEGSVTRMQHLIDYLLDMSRLERGVALFKFQEVNAQMLLQIVISEHEPKIRQTGQTIHLYLPKTALIVRADPDRLMQAISNLLANASNYTPNDGAVMVRLSQMRDEHGHENAMFEVIDTGVGIPHNQQADIFEPFYRISNDGYGSGLGLSIAREIVAGHGGTIWVESQLGVGSCFRFCLPLVLMEQPVEAGS